MATKLSFSVQPANTAQDATMGGITVRVLSASNNTAATSNATVALTITNGTGSPAGTLTCTANPKAAVAGIVTFSGCKINKRSNNNYTLTATSPGLTSATSSAFKIT